MNERETPPSAPPALAQRLYQRWTASAGVIPTHQLPGGQTPAAAQRLLQRSQLPAQLQARYDAVGIIQPQLTIPERSRVEALGESIGRSPEWMAASRDRKHDPGRDIGAAIGLPTLPPDPPAPWPSSSASDAPATSFTPGRFAAASASAPADSGAFRVSRRAAPDRPQLNQEPPSATSPSAADSLPVSLPVSRPVSHPPVAPGIAEVIARSPEPVSPAAPDLTSSDRTPPDRMRVQLPRAAMVMRQIANPAAIATSVESPLSVADLPFAAPIGVQRSPLPAPATTTAAPTALTAFNPAPPAPELASPIEEIAPLRVRGELRSSPAAPLLALYRETDPASITPAIAAPPPLTSPLPPIAVGPAGTLTPSPSMAPRPTAIATVARAPDPALGITPWDNPPSPPLTLARQPLPGLVAAPPADLSQGFTPPPLTLHTPSQSGVIAREPLDSAPTVASPAIAAPPPPPPPSGPAAETDAGPDLKQLAEQVSRILHRQLTVERERRGISRW